MKVLTIGILCVFLGVLLLSILEMSGHNTASHSSAHCPLMAHEQVICTMSLSDHISAWKAVFTNAVVSVLTVVTTLGITALALVAAPHLVPVRLSYYICIHWQQLRTRTYAYTLRSHQELFSRGLLHPKLF